MAIKDTIVPAFVGTATIKWIVTRGYGALATQDELTGTFRVLPATQGVAYVGPSQGGLTTLRPAINGMASLNDF